MDRLTHEGLGKGAGHGEKWPREESMRKEFAVRATFCAKRDGVAPQTLEWCVEDDTCRTGACPSAAFCPHVPG